MSPRQAGLLLLLAFLLGVFVAVHELRGPAEPGVAEEGGLRLFPAMDAEQIDEIHFVSEDDRAVRGERADGGWQLLEPLHCEGDESIWQGMAASLAGLVAEARIEPRDGLGEFDLDSAAHDLRFRAAGEWHGLRIGRNTPVGGNTYVSVVSVSESQSDTSQAVLAERVDVVYSVPSWRTNGLRHRLDELRNRRVLAFDPLAVSRLRASWPGGGAQLERRDGGWGLVEPVTGPADASAVEGLLSDLAFLRAEGFLDEPASAEQLGLDEPAFALVLSGEDLELEFALGQERNGRRAARGARGVLFFVESERIEDFPRELVAWRDKSLARFEPAAAQRLELVFAGEPVPHAVALRRAAGGWQDEAGGGSPQRAQDLVAEIARLEGIDIVAESLGEAELAGLGVWPPRLRIRVFGTDGQTGDPVSILADVAVGIQAPGGGFFAQRAGSPQVLRIGEEWAARLPSSHADWQARFVSRDAAGADSSRP